MSSGENVCSFCPGRANQNGADKLVTAEGFKHWCGQCMEGAEFLYGNLSAEALVEKIARIERYFEKNPISPNVQYPGSKPEFASTYLGKLRLQACQSGMQRVLDIKKTV